MNALPLRLARQTLAVAVSLALLAGSPGGAAWAGTAALTAPGTASVAPAATPGGFSLPVMDVSLGSQSGLTDLTATAPGTTLPLDANISQAAPGAVLPGAAETNVAVAAAGTPGVGTAQASLPAAQVSNPGSAEYARAVEDALAGRPVSRVNGLLQESGAAASEQTRRSGPAVAFEAVAQALPEGSPLRYSLLSFAKAMSGGASAARRYELDRAWEDVAAPYRREDLIPKETVEAGQQARLLDLSALSVPESRLRYVPDPSLLPESTESIPGDKELFIGQKQGVRSLVRGLRLSGSDANVFVTGESSVGKVTAAAKEAKRLAEKMPKPEDLVRVPDLKGEGDPLFLRLPAGSGKRFVAAAQSVLEAMTTKVPAAIEELKLDEQVAQVMEHMKAEIEPQLAPLRDEINGTTVKEGLRLKFYFETRPGGFLNGIQLAKADGTPLDTPEKITEFLKDKPWTVAEVMKEFQEKASAFRPRIAQVFAPFVQAFQHLDQQLTQIRQQAVNQVVEGEGQALVRVAKRMQAGATHDDEAHRKLGERFKQASTELKQKTEERMAAWEKKLAGFDVQGFGLGFVEIPMPVQIGPLMAIRKVKQLTVTYKGKALHSPEAIAALREDGYELPADEPQGQPGADEHEQAEKGPTPMAQALGELAGQVLEAAKPVLDEQGQITEDLEDGLAEIRARFEEEHEAIHEGDNAYQVMKWIGKFLNHLAENFEEFIGGGKTGAKAAMMRKMAEQLGLPFSGGDSDPKENYKLQVLVDNARTQGAPVRIPKDYSWRAMFGSVSSSRRLIMGPQGPLGVAKKDQAGPDIEQVGEVQKANGGFLILEVEKLFRYPDVAHALFDMIERGEAEFTEEGILSILYDRSARYPVPVNVKVILTGPPIYLHLLRYYVPQFANLFNMVAQFENAMYVGGRQAAEVVAGYLTFMRNVIDKFKLPHFSKGAISRLIEHAAREADSNEKVSLNLAPLERLMREASLYANDASNLLVQREDVEKAITETSESESLYRDLLYNLIADKTFWVNVEGALKDTITGLAVIGGGEGFGVPSRISVKTYAAKSGEIVASTEKDAKLVGTSFEQSIGNVTGFFQGVLGRIHLLPFQARVKFEQNYGGIDGDSATQTMIYLVGASLAGKAIRQNFAITGSADQDGNVQAIGGINQKIEGAWAVFKEMRRRAGKPLTKEEPYTIIFPAANIRELALLPDVAQAVKDGLLILKPVVHVSQGFELLTGTPYADLVSAWRAYRQTVVEENRVIDKPSVPVLEPGRG